MGKIKYLKIIGKIEYVKIIGEIEYFKIIGEIKQLKNKLKFNMFQYLIHNWAEDLLNSFYSKT